MKVNTFLDLKTCEIESPSESFAYGCDLVELDGKFPEFGFVRPKKISWRAYLENYKNPIEVLKSKKLAKSILKLQESLKTSDYSIEVHPNISKSQFSSWLKIYNSIIGSKEKGKINITENWLDKKSINQGEVWGVLLYKNGVLDGGNIGTYAPKMLKISFGITKKNEDINWGSLVDFETLKFGLTNNYKIISFGRDTNLYGHHLSSGLFSYKARFGLTPEPIEKLGFVTTKFLNFNKFSEKIVFLNDRGEVQLIYKTEAPDEREFRARGVGRVNLIDMNSL